MISTLSPLLQLRRMRATQTQKEVIFNESMNVLEAAVNISVKEATWTPPANPQNGDRYLVNPGASGDFLGRDNMIAAYYDGWIFISPQEGWIIYDQSLEAHYTFKYGYWQPLVDDTPQGRHTIYSSSSANTSLSEPDFYANIIFDINVDGPSGTLGLPPGTKGVFIVWFSSSDPSASLLVEVEDTSGSSVLMTAGEKKLLHTDGDNVREAL